MRTVTWRLATESDLPALKSMHAEMEKKIGHRMDFPDPFIEPVLCTVVGEVNGIIIQSLSLEATAEAAAGAPHVLSAKEMSAGIEVLESVARAYKIRLVRCFVPMALALPNKDGRPSAIERLLKKLDFTRERPGYQQFFRWLARRD